MMPPIDLSEGKVSEKIDDKYNTFEENKIDLNE